MLDKPHTYPKGKYCVSEEFSDNSVSFCRFATSPVLRDPVVRKNHIEVQGRHSYFAALRHDVLERFKGASLY